MRLVFPILLSLIYLINGALTAQEITWVRTNQSLNGNVNQVLHIGGDLFAGTVQGVHFSSDKGETWELRNNGLSNVKAFAFTYSSNSSIFCGTHGGVYFSSDKGLNWTEKNTGLTDKYVTALYHHNGDTIYAGTLYSGMFVSYNLGASWQQIKGDFTNKAVNAIAVRHTGEIYVGTTSGLYRSDRNKQNYLEMKGGLPDKPNVYSITIRSNGIVYLGTRDGHIYMTINNGNSFTLQLDVKEKKQIYTTLLTSKGALLAGSYGKGVFRSNDNAVTWEQINDGLSNLQVMYLTQDNDGDFYAATWGSGVFRGSEPPIATSASGIYCAGEQIDVTFTIKALVNFEQGNTFYVELSDANGSFAKPDTIGSLLSTQGGMINCRIPKTAVSGTGYKVRVVSTSPSSIGSSQKEQISISELPNVRIYGKTLVCINSSEPYSVLSIPNTLTTWSVNGGIIKSSPNGDTVDVDWIYSENAEVIVIRENVITKCTDTSIVLIRFLPRPPKPTITRMDSSLVSSANSGNQWYKNGEIMPGETDKILQLKGPGLYSVEVTDNNGCTSDISDIFDFNVNSIEDNSRIVRFEAYPMPAANDLLNIELELSFMGNAAIELYALSGELLLTKDISQYDGFSKHQIDVSNITNGTYYIKVRAGASYLYKRIVIIR